MYMQYDNTQQGTTCGITVLKSRSVTHVRLKYISWLKIENVNNVKYYL